MWPGSVGTIMKSQIVLNAQKNPYLNQATRKILAIIFHPKSKIPNPKKSFDYPCHLKSGVPPPDPQPPPPPPAGVPRAQRRKKNSYKTYIIIYLHIHFLIIKAKI